jgi:hypothetical protein
MVSIKWLSSDQYTMLCLLALLFPNLTALNSSCDVTWMPRSIPNTRAACATTTQRRSDASAPAYGVLFACMRNNTDAIMNTYCGECTKPLWRSIHTCGFADSQYFAVVGHTAMLFLQEYINTVARSLFLYHVVPMFPSLPLSAAPETYLLPPPYPVISPWWYCRNLLLLISGECSAVTACPR